MLIVDDQALVREGNALILESDPRLRVVGQAGSGEEAIALVPRLAPDVVLMDVRMPGMGGLAATHRIVELRPASRVIVLTTFDLDEYAFGSLRAGASAFLLKSTRPESLIEAVHTVAGGAAVVDPRLTARLIDHFLRQGDAAAWGGGASARSAPKPDPPVVEAASVARAFPRGTASGGTPRPSAPGAAAHLSVSSGTPHPFASDTAMSGMSAVPALDRLTPRELEVLAAVARGLSNAEIGAALFLAPATVKSHINSIFAKLHLRDRVHAVILGRESGLHR